ncbi:hypothetical protein ACHAQA_009577 [Verticillium albo-atrum]
MFISTEYSYQIMKKSRYICAATKDGLINMIDPVNFSVVRSWKAHSALISDMDAQHDFIVTCGFSLRQSQSYMPDSFLNVFDIKRMTPMAPIPFPAGGAFVRMHPRMSTTSIVVSQTGQLHVIDLMNPHTTNVRQINVVNSLVTMFEIAPSGEAVALADSASQIHLWGSPSKVRFVDFPQATEFASSESTGPAIDWTTETPLNLIGVPYYRDPLLSAWPDMVSNVGALPPDLDMQFLATLKPAEFGLYGPNTRGVRRNQVEDTGILDKTTVAGIQAPKFLSEKARESSKTPAPAPAKEEDAASDTASKTSGERKSDCPPMYRSVEIKYSKFGVDDFDFGYYNRTAYSGLEIHIANSYANALLQVLHFTPLIRNLALQHTATACVVETCLLCELGFLFDMLEKAEGSICQATNLLKAFSHQPQAAALCLLEEDLNGGPLATMLQRLTRFLLDKIADDFRITSPGANLMLQAVQTAATEYIRCMNCRSEYTRPSPTNVNELVYPIAKAPLRNQKAPKVTFSQVLKMSVEREFPSKGWCPQCQRYQPNASRKTISSVPQVLMLNTAIKSSEHRRLWATPGFLPEEIGVIVDHGQFFCYEGEDLKLHLQRGIHNITVYSLIGMTVEVEAGPAQKSHMVGIVNVAHCQPEAPEASQWHLFNDFLVRPVTTEEALSFNANWKFPSVLTFQVKEANNMMDSTWKDNIDTSLLFTDSSHLHDSKTYRTLNGTTEPPGPGSIIALDTEFVAVRQPEIEMNSEGERETIRPKVYALARTSVIRGEGEDEGEPFVDDYILIREPIVDYLTAYSGITEIDLNPRLSKHNLVPLKVAYKKLWMLVNLGCKFLGHGLKQDFRVINIHIPKTQVIDTIELYFLHTRLRKLSLAFLAWIVLRENIQSETHDSIEDSRTALRLYRKYQEIWCPLPPKVELTFSSSGYMDRRAEHRRPIVPAVPSKGFPPGWTPHAHLSSGVRPIERQPAPSVHSWLMDRVHGDAPGFPGNPNRVFPFPPGSATDSTWSSGISDLPASQLGVPDNRNPWSDLFHSAVQSRAAHRRDMVPAVWSDLVRQVRMVRAARALEDVRRSTVFYNVFTKHIPRIRATRLLGRSRQAWPWLIHQTRMGRAADIGDQVLRQPLAEIWDYRPPSTRLPKCIDDAFATWDARESLDMAMPYEEVWKAKEHLDAAFDGWSAVGDVTVSLDFEAAFAGMDFGSLPDGSVQEQQQEMDDTDTLSSDDALDADSSVLSIPDPRSLTSLSERIAHWKKYGTAVERRVAAWQEAKGDALWRAPVLAPLPTDIPSPDEVSEADSSDLYEDDEDTPVFNDPLLEKVRLWQLSKGDALWRAPVLAPLPADIPSPPASDDASPEEADSEPSGDEEASEEDSFASAHSALLDRSSDSTDAPSPAAAACTLDTLLIPGSYPVGDSDNANAPSQSSGWCLPSWSSVGKACLGATALVFGLASGWLLSGSR